MKRCTYGSGTRRCARWRCEKQVTAGSLCEEHRLEHNARQRKFATGSSEPDPFTAIRCSRCGQHGHNRLTCCEHESGQPVKCTYSSSCRNVPESGFKRCQFHRDMERERKRISARSLTCEWSFDVKISCLRCHSEPQMTGRFLCRKCAGIVGEEARARARASMAAERERGKHGA